MGNPLIHKIFFREGQQTAARSLLAPAQRGANALYAATGYATYHSSVKAKYFATEECEVREKEVCE